MSLDKNIEHLDEKVDEDEEEDDEEQKGWYFTVEELQNTPSRKCGFTTLEEREVKQYAAELIQNVGKRLKLSQTCIYTALVLMHRFYVLESLNRFHPNIMSAALLLAAGKAKNEVRSVEEIAKVLFICIPKNNYVNLTRQQFCGIVAGHEVLLMKTLEGDNFVDDPHKYITEACHKLKMSEDFIKFAKFIASGSTYLSTMCVEYEPTALACFCIHFASLRLAEEVPQPEDCCYPWFFQINPTVSEQLLVSMTIEFMVAVFAMRPIRKHSEVSSSTSQDFVTVTSSCQPPIYLESRPSKMSSALLSLRSFWMYVPLPSFPSSPVPSSPVPEQKFCVDLASILELRDNFKRICAPETTSDEPSRTSSSTKDSTDCETVDKNNNNKDKKQRNARRHRTKNRRRKQ